MKQQSLSPRRALIHGAAWTVALRWIMRGIGFISTVVMARLVLPEDYGIVAMAMLAVTTLHTFVDFGAPTYLLRKDSVERDEINSAWTFNVLDGCAAGFLLFLAAPLAASYFNEPRVTHVLWVLAGCSALGSFGNIGMVLAQKAYNFRLEFTHQIICKILGVLATVISAYWLRDYRALVTGIVVSYASGLILSYVMHPYRPRFDTSRIADIWGVTRWLLFAGMAGHLLRKGDELIAGRLGTAAEFGAYNVGSDLGQMPAGEAGPAMVKALMPVLSTMADDAQRLGSATTKTIGAVATVALPIGVGFAAVAGPATDLILGGAWVAAVPFVAMFSLVSALRSLVNPFHTLMVVLGRTKFINQLVWTEFAVFMVACAVLAPSHHLLGLAWARLVSTLVAALIMAREVFRTQTVQPSLVLWAIMRPLLGALVMLGALQAIDVSGLPAAIQLLVLVPVGALVYTLWSVLAWHWAGRPDGLEAMVWTWAQSRWASRAS